MLDIGVQELLVLMVIALLVFGPDKMPELGRRLGRAMREFRRASDEFRSTIETNLNLHEDSILPPSATAGLGGTPADGGAAAAPSPEAPPGPDGGEPEPPRGLIPESSGPFEEAGTAPIAPAEPFCTRRGGRLLHRSTCGWVGRIPDADRVALKTAAEGLESGLRPCPVCDPEDAVAVS
jgi:TatA/E family protein of Tat protein translocase